MRIFQNSGIYPAYRPQLRALTAAAASFDAKRRAFLDDRYAACHILAPIYAGDPDLFFTNADDEELQRAWARENGLPGDADAAAILRAQIEAHRTEIFYNMDPMRFGDTFLATLPGCVRKSIAWRAAPSAGGAFGAHDLIVCNFPSIIESYRDRGNRAAYFAPAFDDAMIPYAANRARDLDIVFVGGYSRHHRRRADTLEAVAALSPAHKISYHLDQSRLTRLAESFPLGLLPLGKYQRPRSIRAVAAPAVFGRNLYGLLSRAKIVLNGAVDMAGSDRGNMRCWEAMGCGALLVSDAGNYPTGMRADETMMTYSSPASAADICVAALRDEAQRQRLASHGHDMIRTTYSKHTQWAAFTDLVAAL